MATLFQFVQSGNPTLTLTCQIALGNDVSPVSFHGTPSPAGLCPHRIKPSQRAHFPEPVHHFPYPPLWRSAISTLLSRKPQRGGPCEGGAWYLGFTDKGETPWKSISALATTMSTLGTAGNVSCFSFRGQLRLPTLGTGCHAQVFSHHHGRDF